ncbi:hypothetical protein [Cohnella sp. GCM10027633]|uniref:hypothetical protein n=1 Tax=unclassified Cohnella TaxID=2636738 RepID=UPI00363B269C
MLLLLLAFAVIVYRQAAQLRRSQGAKRDKLINFAVTGIVFTYGVLSLLFPGWTSPNEPIRLVFEPVQRWILQIPPEPGTNQ